MRENVWVAVVGVETYDAGGYEPRALTKLKLHRRGKLNLFMMDVSKRSISQEKTEGKFHLR